MFSSQSFANRITECNENKMDLSLANSNGKAYNNFRKKLPIGGTPYHGLATNHDSPLSVCIFSKKYKLRRKTK